MKHPHIAIIPHNHDWSNYIFTYIFSKKKHAYKVNILKSAGLPGKKIKLYKQQQHHLEWIEKHEKISSVKVLTCSQREMDLEIC